MELAVQIAAIGILVVFLTLIMLYLVLIALSALMKTPKEAACSQATQEQEAGIPAQHLAAIAGALATMGVAGRIHSIRVCPRSNWHQKSLTETIDQGRIT